jgi:hypothetical protein
MPLNLTTPLDKTVQRIARKVRVSRLEYDDEDRRVSLMFDYIDSNGNTIGGDNLWFRLTDPNLFQPVATLKVFKDLRALAYAHGQNAGLFGAGAVED